MVGKNYQKVGLQGLFNGSTRSKWQKNGNNLRKLPLPDEASINHVVFELCKELNFCSCRFAGYAFIDGGCPVVSSTRIHILPSGLTFDPEVTI